MTKLEWERLRIRRFNELLFEEEGHPSDPEGFNDYGPEPPEAPPWEPVPSRRHPGPKHKMPPPPVYHGPTYCGHLGGAVPQIDRALERLDRELPFDLIDEDDYQLRQAAGARRWMTA